jgi:glutathione S-transferase
MKLYNMNLSNFASKCRLAIYEKNAPVEIMPIPGNDLKSPEYLKIYPLGKTPALAVDGQIIGESEIINEYLEEKFPHTPLLPKSPEERAKVRGVARFHDLYLEPPLRALFPQVTAAQKDQALIAEKLAEIKTRLDQLEGMLSPAGPYAMGGAFTLADCALVPTFFFTGLLLPMLGAPPFTEGHPRLAAWWTKVQERPSVQKVIGEQQMALAQMQQQQGR